MNEDCIGVDRSTKWNRGSTNSPLSRVQSDAEVSAPGASIRAKGAAVVYVRVDMNNFPNLPVDEPVRAAGAPVPPVSASEIALDSGLQTGDILITKRHWGAFADTDLEQVLRQREVDTVVLGGISTNVGVESTARQGTGLGFALVVSKTFARPIWVRKRIASHSRKYFRGWRESGKRTR